MLKHLKISIIIGITLVHLPIKANEIRELDFELDFFQGGGEVPKVFRSTSGIVAGKYFSNVTLNGKFIGSKELIITRQDEDEDKLCFSPEFAADIDLKLTDESYYEGLDVGRNCLDLQRLDYTSVAFNISNQSLVISIPQLYLKEGDTGDRSDYGINGIRVAYGLNSSVSSTGSEALHGQFRSRINLSNWIVYTDFTGSWTSQNTDTHFSNLYAQLALPSIDSDLTIGKSYVGGNGLMDGFAYGGIGLSSNYRMKGTRNSYIPLITGIAKTNSRVVVKQHGRIVHSETITPGPYRIANFMTVGSGDLVVEVKGDDGSVDVKTYPLMTLPSLLKEDYFDYSIVAGKRYEGSGIDGLFDSDRNFLYLEGKYGFSLMTLESSVLLDEQYQGLGLGTTFYLGRMGALSLEGGLSYADYDNGDSLQGGTFGIKYAYKLSDKTNMQLTAYKYQNEDYVGYYAFNPELSSVARARQKGRFETMLSHTEEDYNISLTAWQQTYWNNDNKSTGASAALSGRWSDKFTLGFNLSYSKSDGVEDISGGINLSVPLQYGSSHHYLSSSISSGKDSDTVLSTNASGNLSDRLSYGMSVSSLGVDMNSSYRFDASQLTGAVSYNDGDTTLMLGASGTAMWTAPSGVLFSNIQNDTVALVGTEGISGIAVNSSHTNEDGFAVVGLQPYSDNGLRVDVATIPLEVEMDTGIRQVNPTEGAIVYHKVKADRIYRYIVAIRDSSNNYIGGGEITSEGTYLGTIAPNGMAVFALPKVVDKVTVLLNDESRQCQMDLRGIQANVKKTHEVICE
ncbi:fimbria/pilus outer membrane usher protein [Shewanella algae]|uniref:fimbria/pilus outer membrane usher protein n=1 Tax=Shewanella algae TaxID=38313 RepID=UPI0031F53F49